MKHRKFTASQLAYLRQIYSAIPKCSPEYLPRIHAIFAGCTDTALAQIAGAGIHFISALARNEQARRRS